MLHIFEMGMFATVSWQWKRQAPASWYQVYLSRCLSPIIDSMQYFETEILGHKWTIEMPRFLCLEMLSNTVHFFAADSSLMIIYAAIELILFYEQVSCGEWRQHWSYICWDIQQWGLSWHSMYLEGSSWFWLTPHSKGRGTWGLTWSARGRTQVL